MRALSEVDPAPRGCLEICRPQPLTFLVLVIRADDQADVHCGCGIEIDEFKTRVVFASGAGAGIYGDADIFLGLVDGEVINLVVFAVVLFRLHHEAATRQLAQHAGFTALGVEHQHLGLRRDIHPFKPASVRAGFCLWHLLDHCTCSPNALTGSISTRTSLILASEDFNSAGMESYFLNHRSARLRSPVASISSNSLASAAMAPGILVKLITYFPVLASYVMAPCSER